MDGSETATLGGELGAPFRAYSRPGLQGLELLRAESTSSRRAPSRATVACGRQGHVGRRPPADAAVLPLGQDARFAADLGAAVRHRRRHHRRPAGGDRRARARRSSEGNPLAEGAPLAQSHGTRYPLVQGPMTRVSDRAEFAAAVAEGGALPFLALALMRARRGRRAAGANRGARWASGPGAWACSASCPRSCGPSSWRSSAAHRPPFALIAGGRPDQARELEAEGIATYLHVPSPGLLRLYLADGARRFVFEGRECGGHVGPRTSFVLWDTMLRVLLEELPRRRLRLPRAVRRRHPRRALGRDGRRGGGGRE